MHKVMLHHACGSGLKWYEAAKDRHHEYANINGYEQVLSMENKTGYMPHWERYRLCLEVWERSPDAAILWLDSDCCIATNEDIMDSIPESVDLALLRCKLEYKWRSGVFVAKGTDVVKTIFREVLAKGPVHPKTDPWDDEHRLNNSMRKIKYKPYPLQAFWNQIVKNTPATYPAFAPEVKIAALHGTTPLIKLAYVMDWAKNWRRYDPSASNTPIPAESEMCFYIRCDERTGLCDQALTYLRRVWPSVQVMLVDDGTGLPEMDVMRDKHNVTLYREPHDYTVTTGGIMWQKQLGRFLTDSQAKYLIKIDTDTLILKKPRTGFFDDGVFGCLCRTPTAKFIHGGFFVICRDIAKKTFESEELLKDKYNSLSRGYLGENEIQMPQEDKNMSLAAVANGAVLRDYTEVGNSFIHPVKRIV